MRLLWPGQFIVKMTKSGMEFFYFESGKCLEKYGISSVQMWRNPELVFFNGYVLVCTELNVIKFIIFTDLYTKSWHNLGSPK